MELEAYQKAKEFSADNFKRVGWKQLYMVLLEAGWFKAPDKSPIESVALASFEDAVSLISIENATR